MIFWILMTNFFSPIQRKGLIENLKIKHERPLVVDILQLHIHSIKIWYHCCLHDAEFLQEVIGNVYLWPQNVQRREHQMKTKRTNEMEWGCYAKCSSLEHLTLPGISYDLNLCYLLDLSCFFSYRRTHFFQVIRHKIDLDQFRMIDTCFLLDLCCFQKVDPLFL